MSTTTQINELLNKFHAANQRDNDPQKRHDAALFTLGVIEGLLLQESDKKGEIK